MKVAILFDDVASRPNVTLDEAGVMEAVQGVEEALGRLGHDVVRVPAGASLHAWSRVLLDTAPDMVFNLCEGLGGRSEGEVLAARVVEEIGIPMTGSPSWTLALARRKDRVNAILEDRSLPVPSWGLWEGADPVQWAAGWSSFPAIVKPAAEDGSVGITQASVVSAPGALARRLEEVADLGPLLTQAFVGTREINVGIVGNEVLPPAEIVFSELPAGLHPMVGYEAKWSPGSAEDQGTRPLCPAPLAAPVASLVRKLALGAWEVVGGQGYGRVDFRLTEPATFHILEVNPNPDLAPSAGLARMAGARGWDFTTLVERILAQVMTPGAGASATASPSAEARAGIEVRA